MIEVSLRGVKICFKTNDFEKDFYSTRTKGFADSKKGGKIARFECVKEGCTHAQHLEMTIKMNAKTFISCVYVSISLFYASQTRASPPHR